jgi:hypothetical protein
MIHLSCIEPHAVWSPCYNLQINSSLFEASAGMVMYNLCHLMTTELFHHRKNGPLEMAHASASMQTNLH